MAEIFIQLCQFFTQFRFCCLSGSAVLQHDILWPICEPSKFRKPWCTLVMLNSWLVLSFCTLLSENFCEGSHFYATGWSQLWPAFIIMAPARRPISPSVSFRGLKTSANLHVNSNNSPIGIRCIIFLLTTHQTHQNSPSFQTWGLWGQKIIKNEQTMNQTNRTRTNFWFLRWLLSLNVWPFAIMCLLPVCCLS